MGAKGVLKLQWEGSNGSSAGTVKSGAGRTGHISLTLVMFDSLLNPSSCSDTTLSPRPKRRVLYSKEKGKMVRTSECSTQILLRLSYRVTCNMLLRARFEFFLLKRRSLSVMILWHTLGGEAHRKIKTSCFKGSLLFLG